MKKEMEEQFVAEGMALKRSIRNNIKARRFSIFVLVFMWAVAILEAIAALMLSGDTLTLKHISAQNNLHYQVIMSFIYTLWCGYSIPKGDEECQSAMKAFTEKWDKLIAEDEVPEDKEEK